MSSNVVVCFVAVFCCFFRVSEGRSQTVVRGDIAILQCQEDFNSQNLYSLKWYKGHKEFFRYTPNARREYVEFPIANHKVLMEASNSTHLVFGNVTRETAGNYTCETTAESPSFLTQYFETQLLVIDLPAKDVYIKELKPRYHLDETLRANCTCERSFPAANLTWYIDGEQEKIHVQPHKPIEIASPNGPLYTAHSILRMQVTQRIFVQKHLKIKCLATIYDGYIQSYESSVRLQKKKRTTTSTTTTTTEISIVDVYNENEEVAKIEPVEPSFIDILTRIYSNASQQRFQAITSFLLIVIVLFVR